MYERRNYNFTFDITPTPSQIKEFGDGSSADVSLNRNNILQIFDAMQLTDSMKDVMYTYITGKGKWDDYSKKYLQREFNLKNIIEDYNQKAHIYRQDLAHYIIKIRDEEKAKKEAEVMEIYKSKAMDIIKNKDVDRLIKMFKFLAKNNYNIDEF